MADEKKSFEDLLKEAPPASGAGTVSLVGTLARSQEPGKFVLMTAEGQQHTLETAAVKSHTVLSGAIGQTVVRLDLDAAKVPEALQQTPSTNLARTLAYSDYTAFFDHTLFHDITGVIDAVSLPGTAADPLIPNVPLPGPEPGPFTAIQAQRPSVIHTIPEWDNTGYFDHSGLLDVTGFIQDASVPGYSDPIASGGPFAATTAAPFVMATPHHADPSLIAMMQGGYPSSAAAYPFAPFVGTTPLADRPKRPIQDGTFPGGHSHDY